MEDEAALEELTVSVIGEKYVELADHQAPNGHRDGALADKVRAAFASCVHARSSRIRDDRRFQASSCQSSSSPSDAHGTGSFDHGAGVKGRYHSVEPYRRVDQ